MPKVELLVLQSTPFCNLDCSYCYLPNRTSRAKMSLSTIERVFQRVYSSRWVGEKLDVLWHAGEPLVLSIDYYARAFGLIRELSPLDLQVRHIFQTNGTLIDDAWCSFFKANNVRVGVSIDGPAQINDLNRVTRSRRSTTAMSLAGIRRLLRHGVAFGVISVLSSASLRHARELHDFYQSEGIIDVCFNVEEIEGPHTTSSLSGPDKRLLFQEFIRAFWNATIASGEPHSVREFRQMLDNVIAPEGTTVRNNLTDPFSILSVDCEGNFSTYSPEFLGQKNAIYNDFIIGNVWAGELEDSLQSEAYQKLSRDVNAGVELCRASCEYFPVCGGGSPVNKLYENGTIVSTETMFCRLQVKAIADITMEIIENSVAADATV